MTASKIHFRDLLERQEQWDDYSQYCSEVSEIISKDVKENARSEEKLINDLKNSPEFKRLSVKSVGPRLEDAGKMLMGGRVVGVDGTMAKYNFLSGVRCQIGVVAVNYQGEQIRHSFFISQASLRDEADAVLDRILQRSEYDEGLSDMHLRGLMMYREREAGMNSRFDGKYIMYHGPLMPFEMMSGLGRLRALDTTLDMLKRMVRSKRVMSVISAPLHRDYAYFGLAIEDGQYFTYPKNDLKNHLLHATEFVNQRGKWRDDELKKVEEFISDYATRILIGVIRIGQRPYVFHAHKDIFDTAAGIIARDSMFQREKGFPLLIDYADNLCSEYFPNTQFARIMDLELAKTNLYLRESGERRMRAK